MKSRRATSRPSARGALAAPLQPNPFGCATRRRPLQLRSACSAAVSLSTRRQLRVPTFLLIGVFPRFSFTRSGASEAINGGPAMRCQQFHQVTSGPLSPFQDLIVRRCNRGVGAERGGARNAPMSCDGRGSSSAFTPCIVAPNREGRERLIRASRCAACLMLRTGVPRM